MEIFQCNAQGDVFYILAEDLADAQDRLIAVLGNISTQFLQWKEVDTLPEGEEFL
jgi:hypothetical protein